MGKNVLCKYDGREIYSETELLQNICDKLTYGFGTEYVNVDEIEDISILEQCYGNLEYSLERISTLMDSVGERLSELSEEDSNIDGDDNNDWSLESKIDSFECELEDIESELNGFMWYCNEDDIDFKEEYRFDYEHLVKRKCEIEQYLYEIKNDI